MNCSQKKKRMVYITKFVGINGFLFQYILPAITHIMHQPKLSRGDGPIVSRVEASIPINAHHSN